MSVGGDEEEWMTFGKKYGMMMVEEEFADEVVVLMVYEESRE